MERQGKVRPQRIIDICQAVVRLPDGSLSSQGLENQEKLPWRDDRPMINAKPDRTKFCCWCWRVLPIAEFLIDDPKARTIVRMMANGEEVALHVAHVAEQCTTCRENIVCLAKKG